MASTDGRLTAIWRKRSKGGPMDPLQRVGLVAGKGLVDNANQGGKRQVTLLDGDAWEAMCDDLGTAVDPTVRRANLMLNGVPLAGIRDRVLRIGDCRLRVLSETRPCRQMEEAQPGLVAAMARDWRGGSFAEVITGGEIAVGDPVAWEEEAESG
jgi:MOSC domain-containing protein YiiM